MPNDDVTHRIVLASEIANDNPAKQEIEQGLCSAVRGLPGLWKIAVVCSRTSRWWALRVEGPRFMWMTVVPEPTSQSPTEITAGLLGALGAAKVLS